MNVLNPFDRDETASVRLVVPDGWEATPPDSEVPIAARAQAVVRFHVRVGPNRERRARVAVDLTVGEARFGQQAEALVDVA